MMTCRNRFFLFSAAVMGLLTASSVQANDLCADKVIIDKVSAGYIDAHKGPDSGNSVAVSYLLPDGQRRELMLNLGYNLNDTPGPSLLSMLMMALATGQRVTLKDHFGTRCDDFDEVILEGY